jgi:hypothetical protein
MMDIITLAVGWPKTHSSRIFSVWQVTRHIVCAKRHVTGAKKKIHVQMTTKLNFIPTGTMDSKHVAG